MRQAGLSLLINKRSSTQCLSLLTQSTECTFTEVYLCDSQIPLGFRGQRNQQEPETLVTALPPIFKKSFVSDPGGLFPHLKINGWTKWPLMPGPKP